MLICYFNFLVSGVVEIRVLELLRVTHISRFVQKLGKKLISVLSVNPSYNFAVSVTKSLIK